ncbi:MAG: hypothetical protein ACXAEU_02290 [Candidatus Hodarchaeales archaeon]|jgi:DNA primase large subunit
MTYIPRWYVLQDPPSGEFRQEDWKAMGMERIDLLKEVQKDIRDAIHHYYDHDAMKSDTILINYMKGHLFLRLVSARSFKLRSWIIEAEGDLFEYLFRNLSRDVQEEIAKNLFGAVNFLNLSKLKSKFRSGNDYEELEDYFLNYNKPFDTWCVRFFRVPWLLSKRRGFLLKGWLILKKEEFYRSLKIAFEQELKDDIEILEKKLSAEVGLQERAEEIIESATRELETSLDGFIKVRMLDLDIDTKKLDGVLLYEKIDAFPPCVRYLYLDLETRGYLPHNHRLPLGWFLKKVGMDVETQMRYWYEKSVDNIGLSYEQFKKRIGYQIRHIYGLEGGKIDYNMPKCSTCQSEYFCFFNHLTPEDQESLITKWYPINQQQTTGVMRVTLQRRPTTACNELFKELYRFNANIVHPLQWVRKIISTGRLKKHKKGDKSGNREGVNNNNVEERKNK